MVIQSLFHHGFLEKPKDADLLAFLPQSSRKLVCLEVEQTLSALFMEAALGPEASSKTPSSTAPVSTSGSGASIVLPLLTEALPDRIKWKLPTWQHVRWTLYALAPVFALGLEHTTALANATKIYCTWLQHPSTWPEGVQPENATEFVLSILVDLSELFVPRKLPDSKPATLALGKRHSELCIRVLRTISEQLVASSELFVETASSNWELLTHLMLGITDNLLWRDSINYLADDLAEHLLANCFFLLLKSRIKSDTTWTKFQECFKLWSHRLRSAIVWGMINLALTEKVIENQTGSDAELIALSFELHCGNFVLSLDRETLRYAWFRSTFFIPHLNILSADVFLRIVQALQKIVAAWIRGPSASFQVHAHAHAHAPSHPDANTILDLYGRYLIEATEITKPGYEEGRALAFIVTCSIMSQWQFRDPIQPKYLNAFFFSIKSGLLSDPLTSASILTACEQLLQSNIAGTRNIAHRLLVAIKRALLKGHPPKGLGMEAWKFRNCLYRLLLSLLPYFHDEIDLVIDDNAAVLNEAATPTDNHYSAAVFQAFGLQLPIKSADDYHSSVFQAAGIDLLVSSLHTESDPNNIRYTVNGILCSVYDCHTHSHELLGTFARIFEELLCANRFDFDTSIAVTRALEQLASLAPVDPSSSRRLCQSLMQHAASVLSSSSITVSYRLLGYLLEAMYAWISRSKTVDYDTISAAFKLLVGFLNDAVTLAKLAPSSSLRPKSGSKKNEQTSAETSSPARHRRSLVERVFSSEATANVEGALAGTVSPSIAANAASAFRESVEAMIQKLVHLLCQEKINTNYPWLCDSTLRERDLVSDPSLVKYYAVSSTVIVGIAERAEAVYAFYRCPVGCFVWKQQLKVVFEGDEKSNSAEESHSAAMDIDITTMETTLETTMAPPLVTYPQDGINVNTDLVVDDADFLRTLDGDKDCAKALSRTLASAKKIHDSFQQQRSRKAMYNRVGPIASPSSSGHFARLFLSHMGLTHENMRPLLMPINANEQLANDLERLDALSCREQFVVPVHFVASGRNSADLLRADLLNPASASVTQAFAEFTQRLGGQASIGFGEYGPFFADGNVEVTFQIRPRGPADASIPEAVAVVWCEDDAEITSLPEKLPMAKDNFAILVVTPVLLAAADSTTGWSRGQFYRVRILHAATSNADGLSVQATSHVFGPLIDGAIVRGTLTLARMIRDTAVSVHLFLLRYLQNSPNPITRRAQLLKTLTFRNLQSQSSDAASFYESILS